MSHLVAPSVLSANFNALGKDVEMINRSQADWFHLDVMDGVFVPNISFGFPIIKHIKKLSQKPLDVHLMIIQPEKYLETFAQVGADILTVHLEACTHLHRTIQSIHSLGMKAGVAINPHTSVSLLEDIIEDIDVVCLMSVNPGFGGQKFIPKTFDKVKALKAMISQTQSACKIEIDGGVDFNNYKELVALGADVLVAGNTVFGHENPEEAIKLLKTV
jgi:ribulose-phosphate 3-epimerase